MILSLLLYVSYTRKKRILNTDTTQEQDSHTTTHDQHTTPCSVARATATVWNAEPEFDLDGARGECDVFDASSDCVGSDSENGDDYILESLVRRADSIGMCLEEVKLRVAELKDKKLQTSLRNKNKNVCVQKVVLDVRWGRRWLLAESDDVVFVYDCIAGRLRSWFIKRGGQVMTQEENETMSCLRVWRPVMAEEFQTQLLELDEALQIAIYIVRYFLG